MKCGIFTNPFVDSADPLRHEGQWWVRGLNGLKFPAVVQQFRDGGGFDYVVRCAAFDDPAVIRGILKLLGIVARDIFSDEYEPECFVASFGSLSDAEAYLGHVMGTLA
jgi:hypothetical protein